MATLKLTPITYEVNDTEYMAYEIRNANSIEQNKMHYGELMRRVNAYFKEKHHAGLLLCNQSLVPFFSQLGWEEAKREVCNVQFLSDEDRVMTYLIPETINRLIYHRKNN